MEKKKKRRLKRVDAVATTKSTSVLDKIKKWGQAGSLTIFPFVSSCCSREYMAISGEGQDMALDGVEISNVHPRQADLLLVGGPITQKQLPVLKKIYEEMMAPKWVVVVGACGCNGGLYKTYHVVSDIGAHLPVDIYIPGCPPSFLAIKEGITALQKMIRKNEL